MDFKTVGRVHAILRRRRMQLTCGRMSMVAAIGEQSMAAMIDGYLTVCENVVLARKRYHLVAPEQSCIGQGDDVYVP